MKISEKEILEIFSNGLDCIMERRQIDYSKYKEIQILLIENKIEVKIIDN